MNRFDGKVVLVTGGNGGIGRAAAEAFAREGAKVVVSGRREAEGAEVVEGIQRTGGAASFVRADVAIESDIEHLMAAVLRAHGRLDVVFNNAGVEGKVGPIGTLGAADFDETFGINVRGTWLVMKHALPHLAETKGCIINNASVAADKGMPGTTIYATSKGAINTLTRTAAIEFAAAGVRVNGVSPGPIETDMGARFFGSLDNMRGFAKTAVPIGAPGAVSDIAEAVLYLASPAARFVVGEMLHVDGGMTAS